MRIVGNMKLGHFKTVTVWLALVLFMTGAIAEAREVRCKVLQQKLGRLYFSVGKEEDIWPGCKWRVYHDSTDTLTPLAEGKIAESYEGVSVSDTVANFPAILPISTTAEIEAADTSQKRINFLAKVDRVKDIYVSRDTIYSSLASEVPFSFDERGSDFANQLSIYVTLDSTYRTAAFFPEGIGVGSKGLIDKPWLDGEIGYERSNSGLSIPRYSNPAPFYVALIPNVSHSINRNALLTTALRYKIDTSRLSRAFEFESEPQMSFLPGAHMYTAYAFNIDKAKKLLKENKSAGSSVSIDTYSPTLQSTSRFISGTLAQAGYRTTTVGWNEPSDLRLMILPIYSDSPWVALCEVLNSIAADTVAKDRANQPVRLADRLLEDALQTTDSTQRNRLLERVDRILMEDIGAFPLFRPIIHLCAKEEIRGIRFDKDGRLDLRSIYRLQLPSDSAEVKQ